MSPRRKGPDLYVTVDKKFGIARVSAARDRDFTAREILDRANIPHRPSRKGKPRDPVIRVEDIPNLDVWCHLERLLVVWSPPLPRVAPPKPAPVFIAPEPVPEPEPDPYQQGGLFGLMARMRVVKPELRTDLTVASWPIPARYMWVLLLGYLDDSGRGRDEPRLLKSDLFPLDRNVSEKHIGEWLELMCNTNGEGGEPPLCRYETGGHRYLHATKWHQHQRINRPTTSKLPPCPMHEKPED